MWTLVSSNTTGAPRSNEFRLPEEGVVHIVLAATSKHAGVVRALHLPGIFRELGRIVAGPFGVKLEAITDTVAILPGQTHVTVPSPIAKFELQPKRGERSEAIFLRHGDALQFPSSESSLTCQWTDSEVQVNSSAAADVNGVAETPEDETEDEDSREPIIKVASPNQKQPQPQRQPQATPQLQNQPSITIVQETPTADRVENVCDSREAKFNPLDLARNSVNPPEGTPTSPKHLERESEHEAEPFSTARTGETQDRVQSNLPPKTRVSSPCVQIPARSSKKRTLPKAEEGEAPESNNVALLGPNKRARTSDSDTEDSRLSNIDFVKKEGSAPLRSQRNSQHSSSSRTENYDGPPPRVASSNSTVSKASQAIKFLKKQGGVYVEHLTDDFNVLCVRDGDLQKTTKVLYAFARGIPIVTDQWLYESASAKRFLAVSAFRPSIPKQEEEWKLKLDDVIGQPQTPFADYTIHFTKSLKTKYTTSFSEIEAVCKAAGAKSVTTGVTKMKKTGSNIVLADEGEDVEAQRLAKDGVPCYTKNFFTYSILRGVVDLQSDEFKIQGAVTAAKSPPKEQKKKRGRKST